MHPPSRTRDPDESVCPFTPGLHGTRRAAPCALTTLVYLLIGANQSIYTMLVSILPSSLQVRIVADIGFVGSTKWHRKGL